MKLDNLTDAQLQAELDRRKQPTASIPAVVRNPDWSPLIRMVEDVTAESIKQGYQDDDFKHYIYEMVMKAIYGPDYFKWRNAQRW